MSIKSKNRFKNLGKFFETVRPTGQRAARDEEGKRIKIPADMKYPEWKAVYIDKTKTLDEWRKAKDAEYAAQRINAKNSSEQVKGRQIIDKLAHGEKVTPTPLLADSLAQNPNISPSLRASVTSFSGTYSTATMTKRQIEIKAAEDKAFLAKTDSDFGFRKFKGIAEWAKEIILVNKDLDLLERKLNCQRCVVAHEARMRGYDVIARPSWGTNDPLRIAREWLSTFNYSPNDIKKADGKTTEEMIQSVEDIIRSFGEDARAVVWFDWNGTLNRIGHVIVAECKKYGVVNFGDPQKKLRSAIQELRLAKIDSVAILRVDNLDFTDTVKRCCMNKEGFP